MAPNYDAAGRGAQRSSLGNQRLFINNN